MHTQHRSLFQAANLFSFDFGRSDMERIREGLGSKFSMVAQYTSTFVAGLIVGLADNWRLTLVILLVAPILIATSGYMAKVFKIQF
jgi:ABC-type multidrug transport system fused ATPase/permease subunit